MTLDKGKVVYQIYPKSYKDTTENGIGISVGLSEKFLSSQTRCGYGLAQSILSKSSTG